MKFFQCSALFVATLLCIAQIASAENAGAEMSFAAKNFLSALNPEQLSKTVFDLDNKERQNWHFVPKQRAGLPLKEMNEKQRALSHALLKSALSQRGYVKASAIMSLETILFDLENKSPRRNPELYYFSIFGKPGPTNTWGWRVEGHHLSINLTIVRGNFISTTPMFFGANPAEVKDGPRKGFRALAEEEDLARDLVKSFSDEQRTLAIFSTNAPRDILTGNSRKAKALDLVGLSQAQMSKDQSALLMKLLNQYLHRNRAEIAKRDLGKINEAGLNKIHFGWAGGLERGEPHYYRIQGPTFLMEYDNTQNGANHIHTTWRDLENDFGDDILQKHHEQSHPATK